MFSIFYCQSALSVFLEILLILPECAAFLAQVFQKILFLLERAPFSHAQPLTKLIKIIALAFRALYFYQAAQDGPSGGVLLFRDFRQQFIEAAFFVRDIQIKSQLGFLNQIQVADGTHLVAGKAY
ncbi:hypothetical protein N008_03560 [Hymenobacter sp. APR13]|nr:hypothetical protein N008_03560 [Hymenobacter sp. APR13]